jgi:two-component system OmpR family response regulator/two-component system response regulator CpxR
MNSSDANVAERRVLLIDDDRELVEMLRDYLVREGFKVDTAFDGKTGVSAALSGNHDIVVLDVMMPELSGIQVLGMIRAQSNVPVVMLTAKGDDTDRIMGLELGADDYVPKPCTPRELCARLRAILNRVKAQGSRWSSQSHPLTVGSLTIWPSKRRAEHAGETLDLTSSEYNLLEVLVRHAGTPVSKEELSLVALGRPLGRYERSIDVHISSIRRKLKPLPDGRSIIQTVIRKGYQLAVD